MAHVRQQIRDAFKAILVPALPDYTVYNKRLYKVNENHLPFVDLRFRNENSGFDTFDPILDRTASLYIRVARQGEQETLDDDLDDAAVLIEHAVAAAGRFGGLVKDIALMQTNFTDSADGAMPVGEIVLRYDVLYRTEITDVETAKG